MRGDAAEIADRTKALHSSTQGWHEGDHDVKAWLFYFLGVLIAAYTELERRVEVGGGRGSKSAAVRQFVKTNVSDVFCGGWPVPAKRPRTRQWYAPGMTTKIAVSLPDDLVDVARQAVTDGRAPSVSAFVAQALQEQSRYGQLAGLLAEMAAEAGAPTQLDRDWARQALGLD